ncbi:MAG: RloB family protein [Bacillota bacterium]
MICEGQKTEKQYFKGIFNNRVELGINQLIDIVVIEQLDQHIPHPLHLASACQRILDNANNPEYFDEDEWTLKNFDPSIDEIWLIFDRDPETFRRKQYHEVKRICNKNNLNIGMTNPNFEFWFLLHLPDIDKYNEEKILKNKKDEEKNRRFIALELEKRLPDGYKKNDIKFDRFKDKINLAVSQSNMFETNEYEILDKLGSTVSKLIIRMKED